MPMSARHKMHKVSQNIHAGVLLLPIIFVCYYLITLFSLHTFQHCTCLLINAATTPKPKGILKAEPLCVPDGPPSQLQKKPHKVQWDPKSQYKSGNSYIHILCYRPRHSYMNFASPKTSFMHICMLH